MTRHLCLLLALLFAGLGIPAARAQGTSATPPVISDTDRLAAERIAAMPDGDPASRLQMVLDARKLSQGALFALAETHPGVVEQVMVARYKRALDWLDAIPPTELHRIRRGEQVIRTRDLWRSKEETQAVALGTAFGFKEKKLLAVRAGPFEGRVVRVLVDTKTKGKETDRGIIEMAWPSTYERDEASREALSKIFGARPSRHTQGKGSLLPLVDGSFEQPGTIGTNWKLEEAVVLGVRTPVSDVMVVGDMALDGKNSLRVHNNNTTRLFYATAQRVEVVSGMTLKARCYHRTENVQAEFQQNEGDLYLSLSFEDLFQRPLGPPLLARGRIATHGWELLEVVSPVPNDAAYARVGLVAGLSGTTWFDAITLSIE